MRVSKYEINKQARQDVDVLDVSQLTYMIYVYIIYYFV